jgi:hypothetical protein
LTAARARSRLKDIRLYKEAPLQGSAPSCYRPAINRRDIKQMAFTSWRGVVGCIKPTLRPGGLEELIRMLPEGIGVLPLFLNISKGTTDEFKRAVAPYEPLIA